MQHRTRGRMTLYTRAGARKYTNADERHRFIQAARAALPEIGTFCLMLTYTGCRLSEGLALTAQDIQISAHSIAVKSLKKRDAVVVREVPVPTHLLETLEATHHISDRQAAGDTTPLFLWHRTRAWEVVKGVMDDAGIVGAQAMPKGLRHGFGVWAAMSAVPVNIIQRWLGHENIATTAIYLDVVGPEQLALATRMWNGVDWRGVAYEMPATLSLESGH